MSNVYDTADKLYTSLTLKQFAAKNRLKKRGLGNLYETGSWTKAYGAGRHPGDLKIGTVALQRGQCLEHLYQPAPWRQEGLIS